MSPKIHEANRRPKGRHPLFCFISFIGIYYPLTDIVIVHIVCNLSSIDLAHVKRDLVHVKRDLVCNPSAHSSAHS
jgi:hypothetical protein